ncbi:protein kinase, putative [Bodo saltans]|uniref:Protein kinase, putative n=1 Tax=Bodo saltans TaxID=75058 RepID=A0A0S4JHT6_BODSA|nr:protein kinase, putative [Bodo saltans]|eukprot:CUG91056.1 protein kinase, putative [Bodo saltans]
MEQEWSPTLVEDLLFRRFMKGEDITDSIPPPPQCDVNSYTKLFDQASRAMQNYVRNGPPVVPLGTQNVNTPAPLSKITAIVKPVAVATTTQVFAPPPPLTFPASIPKTPTPKNVSAAQLQQQRTPKAGNAASMRDVVPPPAPQLISSTVPPPPSPSVVVVAKRERFESGTPKGKKLRIEWPSDVPTNVVLKGKSRSAMAPLTTARTKAQECFDPDFIFQQPKGELPLHTIFANFPKALKAIAAIRGSSGDWREDTFTQEEEAVYKQEVGILHVGPSQCVFGSTSLF